MPAVRAALVVLAWMAFNLAAFLSSTGESASSVHNCGVSRTMSGVSRTMPVRRLRFPSSVGTSRMSATSCGMVSQPSSLAMSKSICLGLTFDLRGSEGMKKRDSAILTYGNCRYGYYKNLVLGSNIEKCKYLSAAGFGTMFGIC